MSPLLQRIGRIVVILGGVGALARCGGDGLTLPPDTRPAEITKVKGDGQTGAAGAALPESLVVAVVDARGEPAVNRRVQFALEEDVTGAGVSPELVRTDDQGEARAEWVLGAVAGPQAVVVTVQEVDGLTARFVAEVGAGAAQQLAIVSGDGQEAAIGTPVTDSLVVVATDQFGNPVAGVAIEWDAAAGSVEPGSSNTGADGRAATSWILGSSTGQQTATASGSGLNGSPVTFTATAVPGSASRLIRVSGNGQSAGPGDQLADPLVVRLVDQEGNGVSGRAVSWVVGSGGGSVSDVSTTTDGDGEAQVEWTLGSSLGRNTLNAVVSGVGFVEFTATARSEGGGGGGGGSGGSASRLAFVVQPSNTEERKKISPAVTVAVLDEEGHLVTGSDFEITLELQGDSKLKGHTREKTREGLARFDDLEIEDKGEYRLLASTDGIPPVESESFEIQERGH